MTKRACKKKINIYKPLRTLEGSSVRFLGWTDQGSAESKVGRAIKVEVSNPDHIIQKTYPYYLECGHIADSHITNLGDLINVNRL